MLRLMVFPEESSLAPANGATGRALRAVAMARAITRMIGLVAALMLPIGNVG
jgi:hypothetical protein